ncbi:MAG: hypothetical protein KDD64_01520 [Bdellovibrionales bacterium]|nr:hypothetical protein [Bdellovibrionales bacterium]
MIASKLKFERRIQRECGSTMIFVAAVVVPVLFFLFSLSLDIARYYAFSRGVQGVLDKAVGYGAHYLPYTEAAEAAVGAFLSEHDRAVRDGVTTVVTPERIALRFESTISLPFAQYFGIGSAVPVFAYAESQSSPNDYLVLLDSSSYLSPSMPLGSIWSGSDGVADLFSSNVTLYHDADGDGIPEQINRELVTQQCFNRAFSALKLSAIRTYEFLAASRENAVSVAVYPGIGTFANEVTPLTPEPALEDESDAQWIVYEGGYVSNDLCAAAAEREISHDAYKFPSLRNSLSVWRPDHNRPAFITHPDGNNDYIYEPEMNGYLTTRESLWSQVAKGNSGNRPSIRYLLDHVATKLVAAPAVASRGNLATTANKIAVILAGDLPWEGNQRLVVDGAINDAVRSAVLQSLVQLRTYADTYKIPLRVYYGIFPHEGNSNSYAEGVALLKQVFHEAESQGDSLATGVSFRVLDTATPEAFLETVTAVLARDRRNAMVSR